MLEPTELLDVVRIFTRIIRNDKELVKQIITLAKKESQSLTGIEGHNLDMVIFVLEHLKRS
jgi:hypothetical protein